MKITLNGFGSTRALKGYIIEVMPKSSIALIREMLTKELSQHVEYAPLANILTTVAFASESKVLNETDIIEEDMLLNLLPPVNGG